MQATTRENLRNTGIWQRGLYMLLFALAYAVAEALLVIVSIFQFVSALVSGAVNPSLHKFGHGLAAYIYQIAQYNTFNSEHTPYPFAEWPSQEANASPWAADDTAADDNTADNTEENPTDTPETAEATEDNANEDLPVDKNEDSAQTGTNEQPDNKPL